MAWRTALTGTLLAATIAFASSAAMGQTDSEKATVYHGLATKVLATVPYKVYESAAISYVTDIQNNQLNSLPDPTLIWPENKIHDQVNLFLGDAATFAEVEIFDEIEKVLPYQAARPLMDRWQQPAESEALACLVVLPIEEQQSTGLAQCNQEHEASLTELDRKAISDIGGALSTAFGMPKTNAAINGAICMAVDNLAKDLSTGGTTFTLNLELGLAGAPQLPCNIIKLRWAGLIGLDRVMELESTIAPQATE